MRFLIIGAGFSGAVLAEQLIHALDCKILVIDERDHIGGNCYTERDKSTGITVHKYGPHIFNTDNEEVWNYIQRFTQFIPFTHRVKATYKGCVYSLPINLHTINQFFGKSLSPTQAKEFLEALGDKSIEEPANFEEQALKFIGRELYEAFIYGYTKKQWGCEPKDLPASILKRLPVRFNYDDNYYHNHIQAIPKNGYTEIFDRMLDHPGITVRLNTKFDETFNTEEYDHIFYTGPIDAFFKYRYGRLSYRTVFFERFEAEGDFQGNAVMNYTEEKIPFTRVHEHKHFTPWEKHNKTVYFKEYSKETTENDVPFYPKRLLEDVQKLTLYQKDVLKLENYTFLGRLATYRYMDMHNVIAEALEASKIFIKRKGESMPKIAAVVVTFNRLNLLKDVIHALKNQTRKPDEIIIINNNSTDGTGEWLSSQEGLNVIHQENEGGSAGFSRGMKEAYEKGYDWIWVMDDDVEPAETCLAEMLTSNEVYNNEYDVLQPSRRYKDNDVQWQYGGKFNFTNPFRDEAVNHISVAGFGEHKIKSIVSFPFEGPMFSRKVIEQVGLADRRFFIWYDDTDYSVRVNQAGLKAGLVRDAFLVRKIRPRTKGISVDWKFYYQVRNQIILDRKYGNPFIAASRAAYYNTRRMLVITRQSIQSRNFSNFFKELAVVMKAMRDGFRFRY